MDYMFIIRGYKHENKTLVIDYSTKDVVVRIYELYYEGYSYKKISNIFNEEKVLGKDNWRDSTIQTILENEIYVENEIVQRYWISLKKRFVTSRNDIEIVENGSYK